MPPPITPGTPLYNSRIFHPFLKLVAVRYPRVDVREVLDHAGMERHQLDDPGHWFTQDEADRFVTGLQALLPGVDVTREAGRFVVSTEAMGPLVQMVLGFLGPVRAVEAVGRAASTVVRSSTYEVRRTGPEAVEIVVTPRPGAEEKDYQCRNRLGTFESVVETLVGTRYRLTHPECLFQGGRACRYHLSWRRPASTRVAAVRDAATAALAVVAAGLAWQWPGAGLGAWAVPLLASAWLGAALGVEELRRREVEHRIGHLKNAPGDSLTRARRGYRNALLLNEVCQAVAAAPSPEAAAGGVFRVLEQRFGADRGLLLLRGTGGGLEAAASFGFAEGAGRRPGSPGPVGEAPDLLELALGEKKGFAVNDPADLRPELRDAARRAVERLGAVRFLCCPVSRGGTAAGVVALAAHGQRRFLQSDLNLLVGVASLLAAQGVGATDADRDAAGELAALETRAADLRRREDACARHLEALRSHQRRLTETLAQGLLMPTSRVKGQALHMKTAFLTVSSAVRRCLPDLSEADRRQIQRCLLAEFPPALEGLHDRARSLDRSIRTSLRGDPADGGETPESRPPDTPAALRAPLPARAQAAGAPAAARSAASRRRS